MTVPTPPQGITLIITWEGWHRQLTDGRAAPYKCPAGVWTQGYGSTYHEDGKPIKPTDDPITKEVGKQLLLRQLQSYANAVDIAVKVKINDDMRAALISFAYNVGIGALKGSTLLKRVNAKRWSECPREFCKWRNGGGRVLTGLLRRRESESALFMCGVAKLASQPAAAPTPAQPLTSTGASESIWSRIVRGILGGLPQPVASPA
jgi:lysozyme